MTPTRKKPARKVVIVAGTVAGVLVLALVIFVVVQTRTVTGKRHYTRTRLLPLREWGFGTNARAQVPLAQVPLGFPMLPGKPAMVEYQGGSVTTLNGPGGRKMVLSSGGSSALSKLTIRTAGRAGANDPAAQVTVQTRQPLTVLMDKKDMKVLAPGRSAKYGFFAVESCDGVEVR